MEPVAPLSLPHHSWGRFSCSPLPAAQILDLLIDLRLHVLLLLLVLIIDALISVDIRLQAGKQRVGLGHLLLQLDLLGLQLGLLILQLGTGILKLRLDGLDLFTAAVMSACTCLLYAMTSPTMSIRARRSDRLVASSRMAM